LAPGLPLVADAPACLALPLLPLTVPPQRDAVLAAEALAVSVQAPGLERRLLRASGGAVLLLGAMRAAPADVALQRAACRAVRTLCRDAATAPPVQLVRKVRRRRCGEQRARLPLSARVYVREHTHASRLRPPLAAS
jgi:hypothetical protein